MEEKFKELSKTAQTLVKDTEKGEVGSMLKTMTVVKDRLVQVKWTLGEVLLVSLFFFVS